MNTEQSPETTPLVTIVVLAYNHLDYTKLCIENLFRYTSHIPFELILINNGSSDGTEAFFSGIPDAIKISFPENIGVDKAINWGFRMARGKYTLNLSNDIVVTYHWLDNLIACMESDEKIGMVVPVCSASSNSQQVTFPFQTLDEMQQIARTYNVSNPNLWEERMKLVTYTCLFPTELQKALGGFDEDFNPGAYDDDAISFRIRRMGYKLILARDTYVHHFGSVTFNGEYAKNNLAQRNLNLFMKKFGVHPWQAAFMDFNVVNLFQYGGQDSVNILGIGRSFGSTLLQMKNMCRNRGSKEVNLYYLSEFEENLTDLNTVCKFSIHAGINELPPQLNEINFDYIVVESESDKMPDPEPFFKIVAGLLSDNGQMVCTAANKELSDRILSTCTSAGLVPQGSIRDYYFCYARQVSHA